MAFPECRVRLRSQPTVQEVERNAGAAIAMEEMAAEQR